MIGAEPYININVGSGTVREASEWVEYVTSKNISPITDLRKKNGREKPWDVKYWGIGQRKLGLRGQYDTRILRRTFTIVLPDIAVVTFIELPEVRMWMITTGWKLLCKKPHAHRHLVQGVSLHNYTFNNSWTDKGLATDFDENGWISVLNNTLKMETLVSRHSTIMDKYDPEKKIGLIVDEWGDWFLVEPGTNPGFLYQQNTLRDALVAGINLNLFNRHADRVKMANIAQTVNVLQSVILTKEDQIVLTPTYYVFKMYSVHQDATLIPVNLETGKYEIGGKTVPAIDASASIKDGIVSITMCNLDPNKTQKR